MPGERAENARRDRGAAGRWERLAIPEDPEAFRPTPKEVGVVVRVTDGDERVDPSLIRGA